MSQIVIEKGVPIPEKTNGTGNMRKTLVALEIGDSFIVPTETNRRTVVVYFSRLKPKAFVSRKQDDGTYRIWRTA